MQKSRTTVAVLFVLALVASATTAFGLSTMKADVPFEFVVSSDVLPAGNYDVRFDDSGALRIRKVDGNTSASAFTVPLSRTETRGGKPGRLVFARVKDRLVLSEVWFPGGRSGGHELLAKRGLRDEIRDATETVAVELN